MMMGRLVVISLAAVLLSGCSSFSKKWSAAVEAPLPAKDISGPWEGTWTSDVNGHNGRLRCIITETGPGEYEALYKANYKKIFSFSYSVPMEVRRRGDSWRFEGEANLGKLAGGVYTYEGAASTTNYFSTYDSKYDHGKFEMTRPVKED